jgi:hypothetical protein
MPASDTQEGRRGGRLLTVVFWTGVGLAPVAALLVLVSGSTGLRVAAVLAILVVVLIGLSIMLKPDAMSARRDLEDTLFDEIDALRDEVRQDITTAARATHKAFAEKLQTLYENLEALRGQVEAARAAGPAGPAAYPAAAKSGTATGRGSAAPPPAPSVGTAIVGGGVVRHTETVQVTTRHTIVDPHGDGDRGTVYGNGTVYAGQGAEPVSPAPAPRRSQEERAERSERAERRESRGTREEPRGTREESWAPREESWTEQRLRERLAETRQRDGDRDRDGDRGRDGRDDPADDPHWTGLRAGDRWVSARTDERGREVRMGERRAAVHADGSGTEVRIEDRWAEVRREEGRRRDESRRDDESRRERREREGWDEEPGHRDDSGGWSEPGRDRRGAAALPAAPADPASSWLQDLRADRDDEREREREPRRRRDERWEREETGRDSGTRSRRVDFELSDDRWR